VIETGCNVKGPDTLKNPVTWVHHCGQNLSAAEIVDLGLHRDMSKIKGSSMGNRKSII
jgi:hypothetical protein